MRMEASNYRDGKQHETPDERLRGDEGHRLLRPDVGQDSFAERGIAPAWLQCGRMRRLGLFRRALLPLLRRERSPTARAHNRRRLRRGDTRMVFHELRQA